MRDLVLTTLGLYTLARAVGFHTLLAAERALIDTPVAAGTPFHGWTRMLARWDASYYAAIARAGYPESLPLDAHGQVGQNVWAFFPVFPLGAGALAWLTRLDFTTAAVVFNLLAGAVAAVALALTVRTFASDDVARRAVIFWSFFPTAFVLQVPYSEAAYAAAAAAFLLALCTRRFGWAAVLLLVSALARGSALPLAAAAATGIVIDLVAVRRSARAEGREAGWWAAWARRPAGLALAVATVLAPVIWVGIAGVVTGRPDAYAATQHAWGYAFDAGEWLGRWPETLGLFGRDVFVTVSVGVLGLAAGLALWTLRLPMPVVLRAYALVATALLFAMALPGAVAFTSIPRFAFGILTIPIVLALVIRSRYAVTAIVVAFVAAQYWWVAHVWSGLLGVAP